MPQASDELRAKVAKLIPPADGHDLVDCWEGEAWLKARGWAFGQNGWMRSPKSWEKCPQEERDVAWFLCDEWDYGYDGVIQK